MHGAGAHDNTRMHVAIVTTIFNCACHIVW